MGRRTVEKETVTKEYHSVMAECREVPKKTAKNNALRISEGNDKGLVTE